MLTLKLVERMVFCSDFDSEVVVKGCPLLELYLCGLLAEFTWAYIDYYSNKRFKTTLSALFSLNLRNKTLKQLFNI